MLLLHDVVHPHRDPRVTREAETLAANGYEVTVIAWDRSGEHPVDQTDSGFRILRVGPQAGAGNLGFIGRAKVFRAVRRNMVEAAMRTGAQVVHAHDLETLPIGAQVKRRLRVPLVFDAHEDWPAMEAAQSRVMGLVARLLEWWYLGKADAVVTMGDHLAGKYRSKGKETVVLLNCKPLRGSPMPVREPGGRARLGLQEGDFVVGAVGGIYPGIGYEVLMDSMRELGPEGVRLLVVGGKPDQVRSLERDADARDVRQWCAFTGHVPQAEVPRYTALCDAGVLSYHDTPNWRHALPNRVFEYMAAGIPTISSDLPDLRATLGNPGMIEFVRPGSAADIVAATRKLMADPGRRREMGAAARRAYEKTFCWERQESKLLRLYKELVPA
jgi:glycosyltransferase involved in cell wall biosynthesis